MPGSNPCYARPQSFLPPYLVQKSLQYLPHNIAFIYSNIPLDFQLVSKHKEGHNTGTADEHRTRQNDSPNYSFLSFHIQYAFP